MSELRLPKLNRVLISGRITKDIELRTVGSGKNVVNFTVANDKSSKNADGSYNNQSIFIEMVAWEGQATKLNEQARKGTAVIVEGRIDVREYTDKNEQKRKQFEIVAEYIQILDMKPASGQSVNVPDSANNAPTETNDDVPF